MDRVSHSIGRIPSLNLYGERKLLRMYAIWGILWKMNACKISIVFIQKCYFLYDIVTIRSFIQFVKNEVKFALYSIDWPPTEQLLDNACAYLCFFVSSGNAFQFDYWSTLQHGENILWKNSDECYAVFGRISRNTRIVNTWRIFLCLIRSVLNTVIAGTYE